MLHFDVSFVFCKYDQHISIYNSHDIQNSGAGKYLGGHLRCSRSDTSHLSNTWKELEPADSVAFTVSPAQAIAEVLHIENLTT